MSNIVSKDSYILELKEDILVTTLKGIIKMDVVLRLFSDMRDLVNENNGHIKRLVSDARRIKSLQTVPEDYNVLPQLSKGLEDQNIICKDAKNAFIVGHEDHHLAAELLGLTFKKLGISHELKPFKSLAAASVWLDLSVENFIPKDINTRKRPLESAYLFQSGGSQSM